MANAARVSMGDPGACGAPRGVLALSWARRPVLRPWRRCCRCGEARRLLRRLALLFLPRLPLLLLLLWFAAGAAAAAVAVVAAGASLLPLALGCVVRRRRRLRALCGLCRDGFGSAYKHVVSVGAPKHGVGVLYGKCALPGGGCHAPLMCTPPFTISRSLTSLALDMNDEPRELRLSRL